VLKGCLGWKDFVDDIVQPFTLYLHTIGEGWYLTGLGLKQAFMQPGRHKRMRLKRTQTIMQDASHCDFHYTLIDEPKTP